MYCEDVQHKQTASEPNHGRIELWYCVHGELAMGEHRIHKESYQNQPFDTGN